MINDNSYPVWIQYEFPILMDLKCYPVMQSLKLRICGFEDNPIRGRVKLVYNGV